jgi:hypothetical protein
VPSSHCPPFVERHGLRLSLGKEERLACDLIFDRPGILQRMASNLARSRIDVLYYCTGLYCTILYSTLYVQCIKLVSRQVERWLGHNA